jgi:hypothetical protein
LQQPSFSSKESLCPSLTLPPSLLTNLRPPSLPHLPNRPNPPTSLSSLKYKAPAPLSLRFHSHSTPTPPPHPPRTQRPTLLLCTRREKEKP